MVVGPLRPGVERNRAFSLLTMTPRLLVLALDVFQLIVGGVHHAEQPPAFPASVESRKQSLINNDSGPRPQRPNEDGLDGEIAVGFQEHTHHLVRLVGPPTVRDTQGRFPELAER